MYTPELLRVMHTGQIWRLNHKVNGDREHDVEATSDLEAAGTPKGAVHRKARLRPWTGNEAFRILQ